MMGGEAIQARSDGTPMEVPPAIRDITRILTMHAYSAPNWLAMHLRRHMHLYGTTREQIGWLAINSRRNAALNPDAAYRDPITMEDYLSARMISEPLGLLDCDVPVDGSIAVVVSRAEHADACEHPVRVDAVGGSDGVGGWDQRSDYPKMASTDAAREMWNATDLRPADVDVAELYDGFTFLTMAWLEALGFCSDGESGPFLEGGVTYRPRRRTAAEYLRRAALRWAHARLLGASRGLPPAAGRGWGTPGAGSAPSRSRVEWRWPDRRVHALDRITGRGART